MLATQFKLNLKAKLKSFFRQNIWIISLLTNLLYFYIKLVYLTSQWKFFNQEQLSSRGNIFLLWHEQLVFGPRIFKNHSNIHALVSPHRDGKIIADIILKFNFGIIEGSTNKNAYASIKNILAKLKTNANIVITPDGPRGPAKKNNSNIAKIATRYDLDLYTISVKPSKYFRLKSWDQMIVPYPFGQISVIISPKIVLGADSSLHSDLIENSLNLLLDNK